MDEVLLRPRRLTEAGRRAFEKGDHPESLRAFEGASAARPTDPTTRFNLADGLYKNGKFDEAAPIYRDLGRDPASPLAAPSRFNLGNTLFQKQDYKPAIEAYRDALRLRPDDPEARRNLELALRALQKQQEQKPPPQTKPEPGKEPKPQPSPASPENQKGRPQTKEEREQQRFLTEAGMPKERAEQLLDALQRNEKAEQRKALLAKRREKKGKDW